MSQSVPRKILVVKNRAIGDSIMGLGTVSYIRSIFPDAHITYAIPAWITPLYNEVQTDADEILAINLSNAAEWLNMWKILRSENFDTIFEMFQTGRTGKFFKLFSMFNKARYFFHNHHDKHSTTVYDQGNVFKPTIQRDLDGAWSYFARDNQLPMPSFLEFPPSLFSSDSDREDMIVLGVVATRMTKKWEISRYLKLAQLIVQNNPHCMISIPLSNSLDDQQTEKEIMNLGLPENAKILKVKLEDLPAEIAKAKLYIGNDTGLKHLAAALGVKTYTLFGPEPPTEWHPYDESIHPFFYLDGLECRTIKEHYCGISFCDDMSCMKEFTPENVFNSIKDDL